jgi:nucleotide-binding universal stress UspA family protein
MRILCCLDGTNIEQIHDAVSAFLRADQLTIGLLYVTDSGPQEGIERQRSRFLRPQGLTGPRQEKMQQAQQFAATDILEEGQRYISSAETLQRQGRPEREIVNCAAEWTADLLIISPRTQYDAAEIGPKSVGHVARFVVDHAPCPVLLLRPLARERFPIDPRPPKPPHPPHHSGPLGKSGI